MARLSLHSRESRKRRGRDPDLPHVKSQIGILNILNILIFLNSRRSHPAHPNQKLCCLFFSILSSLAWFCLRGSRPKIPAGRLDTLSHGAPAGNCWRPRSRSFWKNNFRIPPTHNDHSTAQHLHERARLYKAIPVPSPQHRRSPPGTPRGNYQNSCDVDSCFFSFPLGNSDS